MQLQTIVRQMDALSVKDTDAMRRILDGLDFDDAWIASHMPHPLPKDTYGRDVLHHGNHYEVVLATWPVGIGTLPHDHGSLNSHGMVRVLTGSIFNQVFEPEGRDGLRLIREEVYRAGEYIPVPKGLIHRMGNQHPNEVSMSLHVYSPEILNVTYWDTATLSLLKQTG